MSVGTYYLRVVINKFEGVKALGEKTMDQLTEEDLHWAINENSNSIAVIIQHLSGNMISRWTDILKSDGEKGNRNRDLEFEDQDLSFQKVKQLWEKGWTLFLGTLRGLNEEDLLKTLTIRGETHTVLEAIERQMSHYSYHIGQIVFIGKQIKNDDWKSLSIPKGKSQDFSNEMLKKHNNSGVEK